MHYLAGTFAGPYLKRWGCDSGPCRNSVTVEGDEDQRAAEAIGWREVCGIVHLCPAHGDGARG